MTAEFQFDDEQQARVQLLVDALRSGEFVQGRERLTTINPDGSEEHCCLGVACIVYMRAGNDLFTQDQYIDHTGLRERAYGEATNIGYLPDGVKEWYGFPYGDPRLGWGDRDYSASDLNDDYRLDFNAIADAFERTYINNQVEETP